MPSLAQDMTVATRIFAAERQNAKIVPTQIIVDNELGGAQRRITIQDVLTTSGSIVAATGAVVAGALQPAINRLIITVDNGGWATIAAEALEKLEILGRLQAIIDVADAGTVVTISWGFK